MSEDDEINFYPPVVGGSVMKGLRHTCILGLLQKSLKDYKLGKVFYFDLFEKD